MDAAVAVRLERKLRPLSAHYGANEGDFGSMACVGLRNGGLYGSAFLLHIILAVGLQKRR
jgi:hypothetical protein